MGLKVFLQKQIDPFSDYVTSGRWLHQVGRWTLEIHQFIDSNRRSVEHMEIPRTSPKFSDFSTVVILNLIIK